MIHQIPNSSKPKPDSTLIDRLLETQQQLTAVEKFDQRYVSATSPSLESTYRDLIPLQTPAEGEQYSFEIDLDACSGCKSCVAACHSLNGLDEGEIWRNVGLLTGGDDFNPVVQHVTSACHHCLEPACMHGCPVNAYEKDAQTGIVEHLDDQCIGCKYCMFTCPYDVPSYSASKGIVRKCNMCVDRLRTGEAPACVQACPSQAIKIRKVKVESLKQETKANPANRIIPGAPDSRLTQPTTRYLTKRTAPENLLPTDYHVAKTQHAHWPLVFMLTLTQMAAGIFAVALLLKTMSVDTGTWRWLNISGLITLVAGLGLATLHLGRPLKAYRAMANLKTSWLSREILACNLFAGAASWLAVWSLVSIFGKESWLVDQIGDRRVLLSISAAVTGALVVFSSARLYIVTGRPLWTSARTNGLFFLTAAVLGLSASLLLISVLGQAPHAATITVVVLLMIVTAIKLALETNLLRQHNAVESTPQKLAAKLLLSETRIQTLLRLFLGVTGGLVLPIVLLIVGSGSAAIAISTISFICLLAGELTERYLFFAVSVARRMPGAPN